MENILVLGIVIFALSVVSLRRNMINTFKISYYETMLELQGVDISKVKNIGLIGIHKI